MGIKTQTYWRLHCLYQALPRAILERSKGFPKTLVIPTLESESFKLQVPKMDTWPGNMAVSQT